MPYNQKINQEINPYQKYYTPLWAIRVLLEYWSKYDTIQGKLFEPCVGDSAIVKGLYQYQQSYNVNLKSTVTNDYDSSMIANYHLDMTSAFNWRKIKQQTNFDLVITNPPYGNELNDIVYFGIKFSRQSAFLLPVNFIEPCDIREHLLTKYPINLILSLPRFQFDSSLKNTDFKNVMWVVYSDTLGDSQKIISIPKSRIPDFQRKAA